MLVERRSVLEELDDLYCSQTMSKCSTHNDLENLKLGIKLAFDVVNATPTVDAKPVIYCKDCVSHRDLDEEENRIIKDKHVYCNRIHKYMMEYGFCSLGKRKDSEEYEQCS